MNLITKTQFQINNKLNQLKQQVTLHSRKYPISGSQKLNYPE